MVDFDHYLPTNLDQNQRFWKKHKPSKSYFQPNVKGLCTTQTYPFFWVKANDLQRKHLAFSTHSLVKHIFWPFFFCTKVHGNIGFFQFQISFDQRTSLPMWVGHFLQLVLSTFQSHCNVHAFFEDEQRKRANTPTNSAAKKFGRLCSLYSHGPPNWRFDSQFQSKKWLYMWIFCQSELRIHDFNVPFRPKNNQNSTRWVYTCWFYWSNLEFVLTFLETTIHVWKF